MSRLPPSEPVPITPEILADVDAALKLPAGHEIVSEIWDIARGVNVSQDMARVQAARLLMELHGKVGAGARVQLHAHLHGRVPAHTLADSELDDMLRDAGIKLLPAKNP